MDSLSKLFIEQVAESRRKHVFSHTEKNIFILLNFKDNRPFTNWVFDLEPTYTYFGRDKKHAGFIKAYNMNWHKETEYDPVKLGNSHFQMISLDSQNASDLIVTLEDILEEPLSDMWYHI